MLTVRHYAILIHPPGLPAAESVKKEAAAASLWLVVPGDGTQLYQ